MTKDLVVQNNNFDVTSDIELTQKMCAMLMKTKHFAKMGEEGIFAILCKAKSMGINPMDALNGQFYLVNGKLGMSSEMMASLIRKAGHSIIKDPTSNDNCCILHGKRADNGDTWTMKFSVDDAKKAGIYKNMWEKYPAAMAYNRCLSFLARQLFPDVIQGVSYTKEELDEIAVKETKPERFVHNQDKVENLPMAEVEQKPEVPKISKEQAEELKNVMSECSEEYKELSRKSLLSMEPPVKTLKNLPASCYDNILKAALKNRMEYQASLAKEDAEQQEIIA